MSHARVSRPTPRPARSAALAALLAVVLAGCSSPPGTAPAAGHVHTAPDQSALAATAVDGANSGWTPSRHDTCSAAVHDAYSVVGPDGRRYPTWHPPIDPKTGCAFGHEHGRDPRGSALWLTVAARGGVPLGYAAAVLNASGVMSRHEDHVGYKVEWANGLDLQRTDPATGRRVNIGVQCDFLMMIHQGTHSPDAFVNNLHELHYHARCSDGTELHSIVMSAFGQKGEFVRACDKRTVVRTGTDDLPADVPRTAGLRLIPDATCVDRHVLVPTGQFSNFSAGLYEDWLSSNRLVTPDGRQIAYYDPHFAVFNPSRYHDAAAPGALARTIDLCRLVVPGPPPRRAKGYDCDASTNYGAWTDVAFDDPRSRFDGKRREVYFNQTEVRNAGGPTTWYTDAFGRRASRTPFPGSIAQFVSANDNRRPFPLESRSFGSANDHGLAHAPN